MATYVHFSADERMWICPWRGEGLSQAEIARRLGQDRTTISRELRRNAVAAGYLPHMAQRRYQARRARCRRRLRLKDRHLRRSVVLLLERGLSPEQISGRLRIEQGGTVINHETNGLIRRYLPRHTDLNRVQQDDLDAIASELNHRPKKCLGFRTPNEVLFNVFVALSY